MENRSVVKIINNKYFFPIKSRAELDLTLSHQRPSVRYRFHPDVMGMYLIGSFCLHDILVPRPPAISSKKKKKSNPVVNIAEILSCDPVCECGL